MGWGEAFALCGLHEAAEQHRGGAIGAPRLAHGAISLVAIEPAGFGTDIFLYFS